jgi:hypothetical protein
VQIAPRTFDAWRSRGPSRRALWDTTITELLASYYEPNEHGRRRPEAGAEWGHEDVGSRATLGRAGGPVHGGATHAGTRVARRAL